MNVKWFLEPEIFEEDAEPILTALKNSGIEYKVCKFGRTYEDCLKTFQETDCVVCYGSLQFGRFFQRKSKWIPGVYCNLPQMECTYYYPRFGDHLLNSEYVMLPYGDLLRKGKWLYDTLGHDELFVRPSSGFKTFTGKVIHRDNWDQQIQDELKYTTIEPEKMIVVAPPATVDKEWRFVVVDNAIVSGGQYREGTKDVRISDVPENIIEYANQVLWSVKYNPDPVWTLDICESQGNLKVLEVGSFSCAGLYACNAECVVTEVSEAALKEWTDYQA